MDTNPLLGTIRELSLPETKSGALIAMFTPYDPVFPLDAETIAKIPDGLPGPLPTSIETLYDLRKKRKKRKTKKK